MRPRYLPTSKDSDDLNTIARLTPQGAAQHRTWVLDWFLLSSESAVALKLREAHQTAVVRFQLREADPELGRLLIGVMSDGSRTRVGDSHHLTMNTHASETPEQDHGQLSATCGEPLALPLLS